RRRRRPRRGAGGWARRWQHARRIGATASEPRYVFVEISSQYSARKRREGNPEPPSPVADRRAEVRLTAVQRYQARPAAANIGQFELGKAHAEAPSAEPVRV